MSILYTVYTYPLCVQSVHRFWIFVFVGSWRPKDEDAKYKLDSKPHIFSSWAKPCCCFISPCSAVQHGTYIPIEHCSSNQINEWWLSTLITIATTKLSCYVVTTLELLARFLLSFFENFFPFTNFTPKNLTIPNSPSRLQGSHPREVPSGSAPIPN